MKVCIKRIDKELPIPTYQTGGASGVDLYATCDVAIFPWERFLMPTGVAVSVPHGYEAQVRSRSGLSLKKGLVVLNSPGTIDADYRGEIGVVLYNSSNDIQSVCRGDRIAQLVICPIVRVDFEEMDTLTTTSRGVEGFGSTGE